MNKTGVVHNTLRTGVFVLSVNVIDKSLGFVRTLILARILLPEHFGVIGVCWLAISTLQTISETGITAALMHRQDVIDEYLSTAWIVQIVRGCLLYLVLFLTAPFIETFFATSGVSMLLRVLGLTILLSSFSNTGMILYHKEMNFRYHAMLQLAAGFMEFAISLAVAIAHNSIWALVWGHLAGMMVRVGGSFVLHPFRPDFSFSSDKAAQLLTYGKWVSLSTIFIFLLTSGDDAFVGKYLGLTSLAFYQMAYRISNMPVTEITHVISQVTVPAYSSLQSDIVGLQRTFLRVFQITAAVTLPLSAVLVILLPELTQTILGEKWVPIILPGQILCLFGATRSLGATMGPILTSTGRPDIQSKLSLIQLILMAVIIYPLTALWGIKGTCIAVVLPNVMALVIISGVINNIIQTSFVVLLRAMMGPIFGVGAMFSLFLLRGYLFSESNGIGHIVIQFLLHITVYIVVLIVWDKKNGDILWRDVKMMISGSGQPA